MAGLTIGELETTLGIKRKVVHRWVAKGLLARPTPKGPKTLYDEAHQLRIKAIQALRARKMGLDAIKKWLLSATHDQLEALATPPAPAAPAAPLSSGPLTPRSDRWERALLVQGLELHMRLDAGPLVRRLAQEIFERYSVLAHEGEGQTGKGQ